jgi:hypothetical protein
VIGIGELERTQDQSPRFECRNHRDDYNPHRGIADCRETSP